MKIEMVMPQMGESIVEGTIVRWVKKAGDLVDKDENILEISTDKVDSEIPSPAAGRILELRAKEGETVPVGQVIAVLETEVDAAAPARPAGPPVPVKVAAPEPPVPPAPAPAPSLPSAPSGPIPREIGERFFSPLVRAMAREEGVSMEELSSMAGSGRGGRVTKEDLQAYLKTRVPGTRALAGPGQPGGGPGATPQPRALPAAPPVPAAGGRFGAVFVEKVEPYPKYTPAEVRQTADGTIEVVQMDVMRQRIAEHMVRSKATSPHVASVTEVDMTSIVRYRETYRDQFEAQYGFKLTYTPFIVAAAVRALLDYPMANSSVEGTQILVKRYVHVGVAVALESGLIVPVVKHAEEKSFLGLARAIQDLASRARAKKLSPEDVQGSTFSVTNMGGFGNLFGIPIINQPNVGILGAGAIVKRPVVIEDNAIAVRDIMYLSLSYDHRVVDGALGGRFIQRVRAYLEKRDLAGGIL